MAFFRRLGPLGILSVFALTVPLIGAAVLYWNGETISAWIHGLGWSGLAVYVIAFVVLTGLALLPTNTQAIIGGYIFHFPVGYPATLAGFCGASLIAYAIGRRCAGERLMTIIDEHPKWRAVYDALLRSGFWRSLLLVTLVRLSPSSPFAMTNVVLSATKVPLTLFLLGTLLGMAPRAAAAVYIGSGIKSLTDDNSGAPAWVWWSGIAATIVLLFVIMFLANHAIQRFTATHPELAPPRDPAPPAPKLAPHQQ